MKQLLLLALTLLSYFTAFSQINLEDSTVQVIGYWDKNETQTYIITNEKYRVSGSDTTQRELVTYEVDITIKDSTANSYTIEWVYRNIDPGTDNTFARKLAGISDNMKVIIKTNELGSFQEVVNWKEIRDKIKKATTLLRTEYKHIPQMDEAATKVEGMFSTKEAIQAQAIKDVQQFYTYHGGKYALGEEVNGNLPITNLLGGKPFNSEVTILLDEINTEDNNAILRMWQTIDSKELTDVTYAFLKQKAATAGTPFPARDKFPALQNNTTTDARIHDSGWIIFSRETKEVTTEGALAFEERIIEIK